MDNLGVLWLYLGNSVPCRVLRDKLDGGIQCTGDICSVRSINEHSGMIFDNRVF